MNDESWLWPSAPHFGGWGATSYSTQARDDREALKKLVAGAKGREMFWWEKLMRKGAR